MNKNLLVGIFVFALFTVSFANEAEVTEDEDVIVLTSENFEQVIAKYEQVLVKFYAPWCGHCKTMAPAYAKAAAHFKNDPSTPNTRLAKVDATIHKDLSSRFGVSGFPTLKFFNHGKDVEYKGGRDEAAIVAWVSKQSQPPSTLAHTVEEVEKAAEAHKVVVVFFGEEGS